MKRTLVVVLAMLAWATQGVTQEASKHRHHATLPITLVWTIGLPADTYFGTFNEFPGPFSEVRFDHGIRLTGIALNFQELPNNSGSPCNGQVGVVSPDQSIVYAAIAFTDLQELTGGPFSHHGWSASKDLRRDDIVIPAGSEVWALLAPGQPSCTLPASGNLTVQYEPLVKKHH